jgi:hypothetical protein
MPTVPDIFLLDIKGFLDGQVYGRISLLEAFSYIRKICGPD